jgi:methionyl-tRNA formyltransferase
MKIVFMGATRFSEEMLRHLLAHNVDICLVLTIPEEFHISYSEGKVRNYNFADLASIAREHGIPCHEVDSVPGQRMGDYAELIASMDADVILALGWYYMVPRKLRELVRYGAWGIHASLLPRYAGGAPLVWAIINGEKEAGVTLFRFESGVDDGDIITQRAFAISFEDTIRHAYDKVIWYSKEMLLAAVTRPEQIEFRSQNKALIEIHPQRKPDDGQIDLNRSALEIYNFIRAQTRPYPGAFSTVNGDRLTFWEVRFVADPTIELSAYQVGELFCLAGEGYLCLKDGCLAVGEVTLAGRDGNCYELVEQAGYWGRVLGS